MARRSDHTREQLKSMCLQAAWNIIGIEGPEALTARRLAADIGYTPGTIYNIFESMDDLILQINMRTMQLMQETLNDPACNAPDATPLQNAHQMALNYLNFAKTHRTYWLLLYTHPLPEARFENKDYHALVNSLFEPLETVLGPLYINRNSNDLRTAARALWAAVHGISFLLETDKLTSTQENNKTPHTNAILSCLLDTFFAGLQH